MQLKNLARDFCPPILLRLVRKIRGKNVLLFEGNYPSWQAAYEASSGYDTAEVFRRVGESALKVKNGLAVFERDSVCFERQEYRWPVIACLLASAAEHGGRLNVLDFGGSLGSFYFQHKKLFGKLATVNWAVVEQRQFVEFGRDQIQERDLNFYESIDSCFEKQKVDIVLLSSVLQYLESPYEILKALVATGARHLLLDRTSFINEASDKLMIQHVPETIYKASYPAWFFSQEKFDAAIKELGYRLIVEFACDEKVGFGTFKGAFFERA